MPRLLQSPKILTGLCLSMAFAILAIAGPFLAPYSPDAHASTTLGTAQPPSAAHLLGTTQTQQDVLSQLLVGGRSTILVSLVAGVAATALAVAFGVAAGYLGGRADDLLNFGIDEYVNPRLRAAGITGRRARRAGLPRRPKLGLTPVLEPVLASGRAAR